MRQHGPNLRERGMSLVELLAAVAILALAIIPLSAAFTQVYSTAVENKQRTQAVQIAREAMEQLRNQIHAGNDDVSTLQTKLKNEIKNQYGDNYDVALNLEQKDNIGTSILYEVTVTASYLDKSDPRNTVTLKSLVRKP